MSPYSPPRPKHVWIKSGLHAWGRLPLLRAALYVIAMLLAALPPAQAYRESMAFALAPLTGGISGQAWASPTWFQIENGKLVPVEAGIPEEGSIGLVYDVIEARWERSPAGLAMREIVVKVHRAEWADDSQPDTPDVDEWANILADEVWGDSPTGFVRSSSAPGECRLRWFDLRAARINSLATATEILPRTGIPVAALILAGELLAYIARRIRLYRPGHCTSCGYPLQDVPGPFCPECGTVRGFEGRC